MSVSERQKKYVTKNIKRIPLDVQKSFYDEILKPAADRSGLAVNTYIKDAINEKIERDSNKG